MPKVKEPLEQKATNPRFDAMKEIYNNRLDENTESGESLRELLDAQGVEMVDPDAEIIAETKDSDTHIDVNKTVAVDMKSDKFEPEEVKEEEEKPEVKEEVVELEASQETPEEPEPTETVYEKDGKYFTKIKVNGEDQEIDIDTLKASAQKDKASRERFEKAARKEQELEAREATLRAKEVQQAIEITPAAPAATVGATPEEIQRETDELYDALAYEDEPTVRAKLAEIVAGRTPTQSVPEDGRGNSATQQPTDIRAEIEAALEQRAQNEWEAGRKAALAQWEIDYADINDDPDLRNVANMRTAYIAKQHPEKYLDDVMKEAGEFARHWRDTQNPEAKQPSGLKVEESRTDRKRSTPAPVRTNSTAASKTVVEDKPPTRTDVVAEIRAARGQAAN